MTRIELIDILIRYGIKFNENGSKKYLYDLIYKKMLDGEISSTELRR